LEIKFGIYAMVARKCRLFDLTRYKNTLMNQTTHYHRSGLVSLGVLSYLNSENVATNP
jgi:hypothetical protein